MHRTEYHDLLDRYQTAFDAHNDTCACAPERWHRPDVDEFTELRRLLLVPAESGDVHCQYALAVILWQGLCCDSEEEYAADHAELLKEATPWWIAAAKQGYWPAIDNLITCGVGPESERIREASRRLEQERRDLIGAFRGTPVYGPPFMQELNRRLYGCVFRDEV